MSNESELNPHIHVWLDNPRERLGVFRPGDPFLEILVDSEGDTTVKKEVLDRVAEKIQAKAKGLESYETDFIDRLIELVGRGWWEQVGEVRRQVTFKKHYALSSPTKEHGRNQKLSE